jgi:hypothetical protein
MAAPNRAATVREREHPELAFENAGHPATPGLSFSNSPYVIRRDIQSRVRKPGVKVRYTRDLDRQGKSRHGSTKPSRDCK